MKHLKRFNESNSNSQSSDSKASDFEVGDKIKIVYSDPKVTPSGFRKKKGDKQILFGEVGDHFGNGIFILLSKPLKFYDKDKEEKRKGVSNPMGYSRDNITEIRDFELFDNEETIPNLTFDDIEKMSE